MENKKRPNLDELPEILTASDAITFLRGVLGRNAVYELLQTQRIRNRRHGQKFLIPKAGLRDFIECRDEDADAGAPRSGDNQRGIPQTTW